MAKILTIVIPTVNDWDGLIMTVMGLKLYHRSDCYEIVIVDNAHTQTKHSINAQKLTNSTDIPIRYIHHPHPQGVSVAKQRGIDAVNTEHFICMDSHILLFPGVLQYIACNLPPDNTLLQGVYYHDNTTAVKGSCMVRRWDNGMLGVWDDTPIQAVTRVDMQGMGFFVAKTNTWPGFHPANVGFGCEAGYMHDAYRRKGGQCLVDPAIKIWHRTGHVNGPQYPNVYEDRVFNYALASYIYNTVPIESVKNYYVNEMGVISNEHCERIFARVRRCLKK